MPNHRLTEQASMFRIGDDFEKACVGMRGL